MNSNTLLRIARGDLDEKDFKLTEEEKRTLEEFRKAIKLYGEEVAKDFGVDVE